MNTSSIPQPLQNEADVEVFLSAPGPTWLFKHSKTCGISQAAYDEVVNFLSKHTDQQVGMVVVQDHRPLSNLISNRLKSVHQSPQLFLLRQGKVAWTASHWGITADAMMTALTKAN
jgi:bacillithiol system protein YtxJ